MNRTLSIPEWHRLAQEGTKLPVRIPLMGWSMFPLIRYNKDIVTIVPLDAQPQIGDIVLFIQPKDKYIMHRVWETSEKSVLTWGDNCPHPDGWISTEDIWGKAVLIERGKREIKPNPKKGKKWAGFWHWAGKYFQISYKCYSVIKRRIKNEGVGG